MEIAVLCGVIAGYAIAQKTTSKKIRMTSIPLAIISGLFFETPYSVILAVLSGSLCYASREKLPIATVAVAIGIAVNYILKGLLNFP